MDGVLGTRTQGSRMEGAGESTELWRHPWTMRCLNVKFECPVYIIFSEAKLLSKKNATIKETKNLILKGIDFFTFIFYLTGTLSILRSLI